MREIFENKYMKILKGTLISWILTFVLLFIYAVLLTYTKISENTISPVIIAIEAVSILIGSSIVTSSIKKNGIINGGLIGLIYILLLYILSSLTTSGFSLNVYSAIMIISGIASRNDRRDRWSKFKIEMLNYANKHDIILK